MLDRGPYRFLPDSSVDKRWDALRRDERAMFASNERQMIGDGCFRVMAKRPRD